MFLNKSNYFRTVELHIFQLIVILFHLTGLTIIVLFQFIVLLIKLGRIFFLYMLSLARTQVKSLTVKFRLLPRKTSILGISLTFFINRQCFQYRLPYFVITWAKSLGKPPNPPFSFFLKRCDANFECDFSVKHGG